MAKTTATTLKQVREKLHPDTASYREGVFTIRDEFFYTHGRTAEHLVKQVLSQFPTAVIHDSGEVWKAFRGGASTAQSSHWFVKFSVPDAASDNYDGESIRVDARPRVGRDGGL